MRPTSRLSSIAGLTVGLALFAAACSSAAATPTATAAKPASTPTASQAAVATPTEAASAAPAGLVVGSMSSSSLGAYLTGTGGMTLYVLTTDTADTSSCAGSCATNWPPLTVAAGTTIAGPDGAPSAFATITRTDGTTQVTYNHMPLYNYAGDSYAGDTNGQGKNNTWFVAPLSGTVTH